MTRSRIDMKPVFRWEMIPGYGSYTDVPDLLCYLKDRHRVTWIDKSIVVKKIDNDTIEITKGEHCIRIIRNYDPTGLPDSATLMIDRYRIHDFKLKPLERGMQTVYEPGSKSTDFGLVLRDEQGISSSMGFTGINLDFGWCEWIYPTYEPKNIMFLEEKTFVSQDGAIGVKLREDEKNKYVMFTNIQDHFFRIMDEMAKTSKYAKAYRAFHVIQFEHTTQYNGKVWIDGRLVSPGTLIMFLKFSLGDSWYRSWFEEKKDITTSERVKMATVVDYGIDK